MPIHQDHLEALITAVLAVNAYGLEKVYALLPTFRMAGLTDPADVANADVGEVMMRLHRAGYDRGLLTEMMAGRLKNLMQAAADGSLDEINVFVGKGDKQSTADLLCKVKGIGPKVAADAWMLMKASTIKP